MLSDTEEAEMDRARSAGFRVQADDVSDDEHPYHDRRPHDREREEEGGEGMMDHRPRAESVGGSTGYDSHSRLLPENARGAIHPHDRERGMGVGRTAFDFGAMDDFAAKERQDLPGTPAWIPNGNRNGNGPRRRSPASRSDEHVPQVQPASYDTTMGRTNTFSAYGDEPEGKLGGGGADHAGVFSPKESETGNTFHRRRQRKLSQSNPVLRRQGKLALFEGFGSSGAGDDSVDVSPNQFKAPRQPKNLGNPNTAGGFVPFTDAAPGHDRPYRFSFYSNALPVTIHARTLAELPAEGQTFEDLFKGRNTDDTRPPQTDATEYGSVRAGGGVGGGGGGSGVGTPAKEDISQSAIAGKMSLLTRAAGAAINSQNGKGHPPSDQLVGTAEDDPEAFTWWLDVLSPTDEEMRMLSKVSRDFFYAVKRQSRLLR